MDAGSEDVVKAVVDECLELYGRLDVFFANAGVSLTTRRVLESSAEDFMTVMRTNALRCVYQISPSHAATSATARHATSQTRLNPTQPNPTLPLLT